MEVQDLSMIHSNELNERCPFQTQCEMRCAYRGRELDCGYYAKMADGDFVIADQEEARCLRQEQEATAENVPSDHKCVTGWNPSGYCGAASYCHEERDCCVGCTDPCNICCGFADAHNRAGTENILSVQETHSENADAVSLPIVMIPIDRLLPHPDNPRKDLGDLTELADGIKANGVLQNLTVVPVDNVESVLVERLNQIFHARTTEELPGGKAYVVIIGHRRLAAAKQAGLKELPCVVVNMTPQEQIRTMLEENMQRSDLTVYEQAQGFQLMLNMGDTVENVAKGSGFSTTTIRRRLKLLELDEEKFKAAEARGATLTDYAELDKIQDSALKNGVLDKIGTADFKNALKSALEQEKRQAILDRWTSEAAAFAERVDVRNDTMAYVRSYYTSANAKDAIEPPADAAEVPYYYQVDSYSLTLYRKKTEEAKQEEAERTTELKAWRAKKTEMEEITARHFSLRKDFVANLSCRSSFNLRIMLYAAEMLIGDGRYQICDLHLLTELLELDSNVDFENEDWGVIKDLVLQLDSCGKPRSENHLLLCAAYAMMDDKENGYWEMVWNQEKSRCEYPHIDNPALSRLYNFLTELGYEMSDEEKQMRDGTHPLFDKTDAE